MDKKLLAPLICAMMCVGVLSGCVETNSTPEAGFTYEADDMFIETEFTFTDTSTDDGTIASWAWDFGDGTTSTEQNPTHTWTETGTYTVTLTVTDDADQTDEYTKDFTITLKDIVQTAIDAGFDTLVTALTTAELVTTLQGEGPFTVFAPTDDAFAAVNQTWLTDLLANDTALTSVLTYHVISGEVLAGDITDGMEAATVEGTNLIFTIVDNNVTINGAAQVTTANIECANGYIHIIDAVLVPDSVEGPQ